MVQGAAERLELLPYTDTVWFRFPFTVLTHSRALLHCPVLRTVKCSGKAC